MKNRKLKNSIRKHFERVNLAYDKNVFDEFFKSFNGCYHTDHLDMNKKRDKSDFDLLKTTIILLFEEHEEIIKRIQK